MVQEPAVAVQRQDEGLIRIVNNWTHLCADEEHHTLLTAQQSAAKVVA